MKKKILLFLMIFFSIVYLLWRLFCTIPVGYGAVSVIAGTVLLIIECLGMLESLVHFYNMSNVKNVPLPVIEKNQFPDVDIFIATYNESEEILFKTINGCKHLKYPDKSKVHIYLCDDGRRAQMRDLAEKMGIGYLDREDNSHAKAGNLNNALTKTNSPYIVTMDADMIPKREFLLHTIPYFVAVELENEGKEEKEQKHIGFVQTPQNFYNPDLFQHYLYSEGRIPNEQDYFYRNIQVSRNKSNSVIYGGSNTVLSRQALEDIGGFYTKTITEDYATGILMQKKGYICYATDEVMASGLSPTDLKSLIDQRIRWARGVITTNRKMHIWISKELTFAQKINYWASAWYWYAPIKRLIYYLCPILYGVFGYVVIKCQLWEILLFWLPMYITSNMALRMLSRNIRTTKWTNIYETVLFPFLLIPVILETLGIKMKKFKVTQKGTVEKNGGKNMIYSIPFALLIFLSGVGIVNCFRIMFMSNSMGPVVVLFWLILNLYTLVMAMFFVMGRNYVRKYERMRVTTKCEFRTKNGCYVGKTVDISENGLSVLLEQPINVDENDIVELIFGDDNYSAKLDAKVVHVSKWDDCWKYAVQITDYKDTYEEYLQLVYDRLPSFPQELDASSGSFDDLRINVSKRVQKPFYQNRKLPRVDTRITVKDDKQKSHVMVDFNFKYVTLEETDGADELVLLVGGKKKVSLKCEKIKIKKENRILYKVANYDEIYHDKMKNQIVEDWIKHVWKNDFVEDETESDDVTEKETDFDEMNYV